MTYAAYETGMGDPVELYTFQNEEAAWRFTSHDVDYVFQTLTYTHAAIERDDITNEQGLDKAEVKIKMPRDAAQVQDFLTIPPTQVMTLTIHRQHSSDPDAGFAVIWQGRVLSAQWSGAYVEISCEPVFTSLRRPGLRRSYQAQCPHVLYGTLCTLNNETYKVPGTLQGISGNVLTANEWASYSDGWFVGGYLTFGFQRRAIKAHVGNQITLVASITGAGVGSVVNAFAGCDHTKATCLGKFNNILNYGGFPYVPDLNPFGATEIF